MRHGRVVGPEGSATHVWQLGSSWRPERISDRFWLAAARVVTGSGGRRAWRHHETGGESVKATEKIGKEAEKMERRYKDFE